MDGGMSIEMHLAEHNDAGIQSKLQRSVWEALKSESTLDASDLRVDVVNSVATLSGTVASYVQKVAAEQAAHRVAGLRSVRSEIRVTVIED